MRLYMARTAIISADLAGCAVYAHRRHSAAGFTWLDETWFETPGREESYHPQGPGGDVPDLKHLDETSNRTKFQPKKTLFSLELVCGSCPHELAQENERHSSSAFVLRSNACLVKRETGGPPMI